MSSTEKLTTAAEHAVHVKFGELSASGQATDELSLNQFGEMAMQIDVQCEQAVIDSIQQTGLPIEVISEEHGRFTTSDRPEYTAFIDGLDGSSAFRDSHGQARCGTMFSIYAGTNPIFSDYLGAFITDFSRGESIIALKDQGAWLHRHSEAKSKVVRSSNVQALDSNTAIYIDEGAVNYPDNPDASGEYFYNPIKRYFATQYLGSSAVYGFDFARGEADLIMEYGRKNNLEHMVDYAVITEAGGVFQYLDGSSVEDTDYQSYCELNSGYPAVIMAATVELAENVRTYISADKTT